MAKRTKSSSRIAASFMRVPGSQGVFLLPDQFNSCLTNMTFDMSRSPVSRVGLRVIDHTKFPFDGCNVAAWAARNVISEKKNFVQMTWLTQTLSKTLDVQTIFASRMSASYSTESTSDTVCTRFHKASLLPPDRQFQGFACVASLCVVSQWGGR